LLSLEVNKGSDDNSVLISIFMIYFSSLDYIEMPSFVWKYYSKVNSRSARCNEKGCQKLFKWNKGISLMDQKTAKRSAAAVSSHETFIQTPEPTPKRQKTLLEYCKKPTFEEEIARMVCESNLSFNQIAQTKFIRESLAAKYPNRTVPKGPQGISALMMNFFAFAESETIERIKKLKEEGKKFSVTLDEWTSCCNCRFLNINFHFTVSDSDDDSEDDEPSDLSDCEESSQIFEPAPDNQATIKKMPEIIKVFRYSPLKFGILEAIQRNDGSFKIIFTVYLDI
jgi:hypothetical protein